MRYQDDDGNQIVECGAFAYVWPAHYPPLRLGEKVIVEVNARRHIWATVTRLGSELGGAVGFVTGRAGITH